MNNPSHSYLLRSTRTSQKRIQDNKDLANQIKQLEPLNTQLQHNSEDKISEDKISQEKTIIKMASKDDIAELLKKYNNKTRKSFEPQEFGGKTTENAKEFMTSFNNYCRLNNIEGTEKILTFEMCLSGTAKNWFAGLSEDIKKKFTQIQEQFTQNYMHHNKWLNTTRLETRKLLSTESAEKYISDMSNLALLVGIEDEELMKALIRGLPSKLRWHVISFNPTTLNETIQRILLGEATLASEYGDQINMMEDNSMITVVRQLDEKMDKLEEMIKDCRMKTPQRNSTQYVNNGSTVPTCQICDKFGHSAKNCFLRQTRETPGNINDYSATQRFDNTMSRTGGIYERGVASLTQISI